MIWVLRRCVVAPLVVGLAVLVWFTLPLWLIGAAAISPIVPGRLRPLRLFWVMIVYLTCEAVLLVVMFGLWIASGFGWRLRTPYFEGIHYDLVQGTMWLFFHEARRVLRLTIESEGPGPFEPAMVLVLVVKALFHPEPVPQMAGRVVEDPELVGTDPAADVVRTGIFSSGQNHMPVGDQVVVFFFLENKPCSPVALASKYTDIRQKRQRLTSSC